MAVVIIPAAAAPAATYQSGGSQVIALDTLGATTDIATLNSSSSAHGLLPKLSNSATDVLTGTGTYVKPPGFEINYTQITANANITDTSEATATALISPGAIVFDGTAVYVEFFCPKLTTPSVAATNFTAITLFEGASQITRLCSMTTVAAVTMTAPVLARYKFTPTAASHTYIVCGFVSTTTGTPTIGAGAGGTGALSPAYVRFVKA